MLAKRTPEAAVNAARIREQIGHSLRNYYQACATDELPPRLREVLKKLDEDILEVSEHVQVIAKAKD